MRSRSTGLALPVRTELNSWLVDSTVLAMRSVASFRRSSINSAMVFAGFAWTGPPPGASWLLTPLASDSRGHQGAHALAADYPGDVALVVHVEDVERQAVFHAQSQRGGVHDAPAALDRRPDVDQGDE